jgi:hypothetical protein
MLTTPTSIVAQFSKPVTALSASAFVLGGTCELLPSKGSVQMSAGDTIATLPLSGGICTNARALTVSVNPASATDALGNAGTGSVLTRTYTVNTVGPTVSLADPSPATVDATQSAIITATFTPSASGGNTLTGTLTAGGGGVTLSIVRGNPVCSLAVTSITASGATLTLSGCTGNGSVQVRVDAGVLTDALGNTSSASVYKVVTVGNACAIPVGGYSYGATTAATTTSADVNDDGQPDLIVGTPTSVGVLIGCALHTFQPVTSYAVAAGATQVAVGDLNGDNRLDIVAAGVSGSVASVSVLSNDGAGGFTGATNYPLLDDAVLAAQLGDFNADGRLDIVALTQSATQSTVSVLLNTGAGGFVATHNTGLRATSNTLTPDVYACRSLAVLPGVDQGSANDRLALACAPYTTADVSGVTIDARLIALGINNDGTLSQTSVRTFAAASYPNFGSSVAYAAGPVKSLHVGSPSLQGVVTASIDASWVLGAPSSVAGAPNSSLVVAKPNMVIWAGPNASAINQFRAARRTTAGLPDATLFSLVSNLTGFQTLTVENTNTAILYITDDKVRGCNLGFNVLNGRPLVTCTLY